MQPDAAVQTNALHTESLWITLNPTDQLHLKRIYANPQGQPVFMLHGSVGSGNIFYSKSLKGLAPFLAEQGFDVYVADLRGRGQSTPPVSARSNNSQYQAIVEEIPAFLAQIRELRGQDVQIHAVGHSWGGVLLLAYLARFADEKLGSMSFLGSKRHVSVINRDRLVGLDLMWGLLGSMYTRRYGYLPAKKLKLGSDDEAAEVYQQCRAWVYAKHTWIDPTDQFDYYAALTHAQNIAPTLYLAGKKDTFLGHPKDVRQLMRDVGQPQDEFRLLAMSQGYRKDYGHIDMCTAPEAVNDHFIEIADWISQHTQEIVC
ncbi:MAG: alpha/beta fold hydrolase [Pseudomonadota bacterium]|nr:alpha/beta fold hydrolase [Pseudomonadota bacterium]